MSSALYLFYLHSTVEAILLTAPLVCTFNSAHKTLVLSLCTGVHILPITIGSCQKDFPDPPPQKPLWQHHQPHQNSDKHLDQNKLFCTNLFGLCLRFMHIHVRTYVNTGVRKLTDLTSVAVFYILRAYGHDRLYIRIIRLYIVLLRMHFFLSRLMGFQGYPGHPTHKKEEIGPQVRAGIS